MDSAQSLAIGALTIDPLNPRHAEPAMSS